MVARHEDISKHLTKRGAERKRDKLRKRKVEGRSSGQERIDYEVGKAHGSRLRRWEVYAR